MRLCMSVCICAHQQRLQPDNAYLSIDLAEQPRRCTASACKPIGATEATRARFDGSLRLSRGLTEDALAVAGAVDVADFDADADDRRQ